MLALCVLPTSAGGAGELPPTHSAPLPASAEPDPLPVCAAAGVSGQRAAQPGHPLLPLRRGGGVCVALVAKRSEILCSHHSCETSVANLKVTLVEELCVALLLPDLIIVRVRCARCISIFVDNYCFVYVSRIILIL